jgi:uncharacterized protein YgbK (DUF1537 family)
MTHLTDEQIAQLIDHPHTEVIESYRHLVHCDRCRLLYVRASLTTRELDQAQAVDAVAEAFKALCHQPQSRSEYES